MVNNDKEITTSINNCGNNNDNENNNSEFSVKELKIFWGIVIVIICIIIGVYFAVNILKEKTPYCEEGYNLNSDNMCEQSYLIKADVTVAYYCLDSNMQLIDNQCVSVTYSDPIIEYDCPAFYRFSNVYGSCVLKYSKGINDNCPGDSVQILGRCYPYRTAPTYIKRKCFLGTLVGNQCVAETRVSAIPEYTYTCPEGYTQITDVFCTKTVTKEPNYK